MNPFGAWVAGMSSTANPELAAKLAMDSYNNAAQLQGQSDVKMMEMQQKMQDEQLQRQAAAKFLQTVGKMSPEEANSAAMMPFNTYPSITSNALGLVQTYGPEGQPVYTRKTEAPGMAGQPKATFGQQIAIDTAKEEGKALQKLARTAPEQISLLNQLEPLVPNIPESGITAMASKGAKFFGVDSDTANAAQTADKIIKKLSMGGAKDLGVNPSNRDLIYVTEANPEIGAKPEANYAAIIRQREGWKRIQEWDKIHASLLNRPDIQADPTRLQVEFNNAIEALPPVEDIVNEQLKAKGISVDGSLKSSATKPTITNTKPTLSQPSRPTITTQEEYDALPSGAVFIDADDGKPYTKP